MALITRSVQPIAFTMHGAREAIAGGMPHIEEQVKAIEQAVAENAGLAFDLAKTLIESTCKNILTNRDIAFADTDELPRLFRAATQVLPFLPPGSDADSAVRRSLDRTLSGLSTALHGVCELRNDCGFASHGKDGPSPVLGVMQALLAAQAADAIVGFIYRAHRQAIVGPPAPILEYDDNPEFNALVDEAHEPSRIFGLEYRASEVLFNIDIEAYRDRLAGFEADDAEVAPVEQATTEEPVSDAAAPSEGTPA